MSNPTAGTLVWVEYDEETMNTSDKIMLERHGPLWMVRHTSIAGDKLYCESMKDQGMHVWYLTEVKIK